MGSPPDESLQVLRHAVVLTEIQRSLEGGPERDFSFPIGISLIKLRHFTAPAAACKFA